MNDQELYEEFCKRFVNSTDAIDITGHNFPSHINLMAQRGHIKAYRLGPRFSMYSRAELEQYAANRPGKGGRPPKSES